MSVKDDFLKIYTDNIHREGDDKLLEWLEKSDFFTAPASTRFHSCHAGGLCEHSVNVYHRLHEIVGYEPSSSSNRETDLEEATAVCGLLHDVCKANFYKATTRNVKDETTGHWEKVPYYAVEEKFPYGHGEKSVFLIERFMKLTPEEAVAIRFHMGEFESLRCTSAAYSKCPLAVMLHIADLEATYLDEKEN